MGGGQARRPVRRFHILLGDPGAASVGPDFHLGADIVGLFGVVAVVGVSSAPLAGHLADKRRLQPVTSLAAALMLLSWPVFGLWNALPGLVIGVILLDFAVQSAMVSNQHIIFALWPEARNRLNTTLMTTIFLSGAAGSARATMAWRIGYGTILTIQALMLEVLSIRWHKTRTATTDQELLWIARCDWHRELSVACQSQSRLCRQGCIACASTGDGNT